MPSCCAHRAIPTRLDPPVARGPRRPNLALSTGVARALDPPLARARASTSTFVRFSALTGGVAEPREFACSFRQPARGRARAREAEKAGGVFPAHCYERNAI